VTDGGGEYVSGGCWYGRSAGARCCSWLSDIATGSTDRDSDSGFLSRTGCFSSALCDSFGGDVGLEESVVDDMKEL
jgi:hypothetical protein